jgi:outer membrane protein, multidrug efflux system
MTLSIRRFAPLMFVALSGCMVGPDYEAPQTPLPVKFSEGRNASIGNVSLKPWWTAFTDQRLNSLVAQGMAQNLDVLQAVERIQSSEANVTSAGAGSLPSLTGSGSQTFSGSDGSYSGRTNRSTSEGGLSVSWLLDLFGEYRRSKESARASLDAAYASADVARLSLLSDLVTSYIDVRYYQERMAIARDNLKSRQETLELTKFRLDAGAASRLDVVQAEGLVNSTLADMSTLETSFRKSAHHVATLIGLPAASLVSDLSRSSGQPVAHDAVRTGIPADLVRNRPDIRKAERELAAAVADIGVAKAQLFPSIKLSGSISPSYIKSNTASGGITSWSFGPTLNLPIFDGGALRANVQSKESAARSAYLAWKQTVLNAIEEVENAMVALSRDGKAVSASRAEVSSYREALDLSTASYKDGASSLLDVLDAQRSVSTAQANLAQAVRQMAADYVTLNVAIGGGYAAGRLTQ